MWINEKECKTPIIPAAKSRIGIPPAKVVCTQHAKCKATLTARKGWQGFVCKSFSFSKLEHHLGVCGCLYPNVHILYTIVMLNHVLLPSPSGAAVSDRFCQDLRPITVSVDVLHSSCAGLTKRPDVCRW